MKRSDYNYVIYTDQFGYWFNALTGASFRITAALSKKVEFCVNNDIDLLKAKVPQWFDRLVESGFIISDDINELDVIREKYHNAINRKDYFLIVIPTLNCNYKCWYCIQDHKPSVMTAETMDAVKKHIDYMVDVEKIVSLHLDWFGGEPFMYFDKVVKPLSEYALQKCEEAGVSFTNGATTNGYFISSKVAQELPRLRFSQFQITIDGDKQFHDKVKFVHGCPSTFEHVLRNIDDILSADEGIRMFLRINYTHETLTPEIVGQVCALISPQNRSRTVITPKKVWQEKADQDFYKVLIPILDAFEQAGFCVARHNMPMNYMSCYVCKKYYNCINYNGYVVKCTACDDLYEAEPKGVISDTGAIEWKTGFDKQCMTPSFENERCLSCKQLPVCMGLCPRNHLNGETSCKNNAVDEVFEKTLLNYLTHLHEETE